MYDTYSERQLHSASAHVKIIQIRSGNVAHLQLESRFYFGNFIQKLEIQLGARDWAY